MAHQALSLKHDKTVECVFDTSDAGTGKTFVRIVAFAERRRKGGGKMLVLAPKTLLESAWENDFRKFAPDMKVIVARAGNRFDAFAEDVDVYITNHDAVKAIVKQFPRHQLEKFFEDFSELVIDEPTAYKHKDSQRSKAAFAISRLKCWKKKAGLTMTPTANTICDIHHQMMLLDGGKRLGASFYQFRSTVCTPEQIGRNVNAVKWHDKEGAEQAVYGLLQDVVIRHILSECTDIPATHMYSVPFKLHKNVRKAYDQMELAQILLLQGKKGGVTSLNAVNAAAVATKLLQICSGAVYDSDSKYHLLDTSRYEMVLDLVEARKHSLVFFNWKHQRDMLIQLAEARGLKFCVLDGEAKDRERSAMVTQYQAGHYQVMFAHPRSAAHGLTLTKGTATIWPGPIYDLELWKQGNARQARIGQKEKTEVIVIIAKDTIEEKVYELLMGKDVRMKTLLNLMELMVQEAKGK